MIPKSIFGVLGAFSGSNLVNNVNPGTESLLRAPLVIMWVWIVLLPFNIDNQRRETDIEEDKINRPWRPLPSKRLSNNQAWWTMTLSHMAGIVYCLAVGGLKQKLVGIFLGWLYNEMGGADKSCITKNLVNALGYVTFSMGAISVAASGDFTDCGLQWFLLVGCIVFTTVHIQDLTDMEGDKLRGRKTVPLVIGSRACRWSIAILVPFWTLAAAAFWDAMLSTTAIISGALAMVVASRILKTNDLSHDKMTFRAWNLWMVTMYALPIANGSVRA